MATYEVEIPLKIWQAKGYMLFTWAENHAEETVRFCSSRNKPARIIFHNKSDAMMFAIAHSKFVLGYYVGN